MCYDLSVLDLAFYHTLHKVLFLVLSVTFLFVYEISRGTAERIWDKFTGKMCLVTCSDKFECQDHRSRSRSPGTKTAFFGPFGGQHAVYVW